MRERVAPIKKVTVTERRKNDEMEWKKGLDCCTEEVLWCNSAVTRHDWVQLGATGVGRGGRKMLGGGFAYDAHRTST